jgi:hypothetical protein
MVVGFLIRPRLNGRSLDLDRSAAVATHEVMMVCIAGTSTVERFTIGGAQSVNLASFGQRLQRSVHRSQSYGR